MAAIAGLMFGGAAGAGLGILLGAAVGRRRDRISPSEFEAEGRRRMVIGAFTGSGIQILVGLIRYGVVLPFFGAIVGAIVGAIAGAIWHSIQVRKMKRDPSWQPATRIPSAADDVIEEMLNPYDSSLTGASTGNPGDSADKTNYRRFPQAGIR
ncbi:MAG: hypothetical protein O3B13_12680 [Planctomycetota bacterium]|nr:hypothetical protein [Planctomycetota bacterium]